MYATFDAKLWLRATYENDVVKLLTKVLHVFTVQKWHKITRQQRSVRNLQKTIATKIDESDGKPVKSLQQTLK